MKGQSLGSVSYNTKTEKYQSCFYDSLNKKPLHLGFYNLKIDAEQKVQEYVFDYYLKYAILLPKGIFMEKKPRFFGYLIINNKKTIHLFRSKNLKEVFEFRLKFIANLI